MTRELLAFFALAFAISWMCWIPAAASDGGIGVDWIRWLLYAGSAGPALAALVLIYRGDSRQARTEYWDRVFDFRRIGLQWLAVIALCYPLLTVLAIVISTGDPQTSRPENTVLDQLLENPATLLAYAGFTLLLGPIPEELGWRGYALDRLRSRWTPLTSSLLLGTAWAAWHLPQFLVSGTYQHGLGIGSPEFWLFMATAVSLSVLMTWIYNATGRSILSAILLHGVVNFTRATVTLPLPAEAIRTGLLIAAAICIAWWWRSNASIQFPTHRRRA